MSCPPRASKPAPPFVFLVERSLGGSTSERAKLSSQQDQNLRAAIEATCRAVKCRYPKGKFPVRGLFRMSCLLIASTAANNLRRIDRYVHEKSWQKQRKLAKHAERSAFSPFNGSFVGPLALLCQPIISLTGPPLVFCY